MTSLPSEVDVAVIGAGAAGIAAARRLAADSGVSVLVLEARECPGGRAWTVEADGIPMDLGSGSTSGGRTGRRDCAIAARV